MLPKDIPGYYYDAERNRYFKLAHASLGRPSTQVSSSQHAENASSTGGSTAHTYSNVIKAKRQKVEEKRMNKETQTLQIGHSYQVLHGGLPSRSWRQSPVGSLLARQAGNSGTQNDTWPRSIKDVISNKHATPYNLPAGQNRVPFRFFGCSSHAVFAFGPAIATCAINPIGETSSWEPRVHNRFDDHYTSLVTSGDGTRWAGSSRCSSDPSVVALFTGRLHGGVTQIQVKQADGHVEAGAFSPDSRTLCFAGSVLYVLPIDRTGDFNASIAPKPLKKDVLDVQFLDNNVLALGRRSGALDLVDLRMPLGPLNITKRLYQPRGICKIKILGNGHQILAAGLQDLALFDLRLGAKSYITYAGGAQHEDPRDVQIALMADDKRIMSLQRRTGLKLWSIDGTLLDRRTIPGTPSSLEVFPEDSTKCMTVDGESAHVFSLDFHKLG
ncbi:hypothetical protein BCR37DRAFT_111976 [Protomyces lactucae-debilis]|uniref:WD40-repeat-containing domain protein n=1 Tax=Protomyces lactucae-debilis TaxID=2754530 RepID=A0A1Y2F6X4_PROLT|nr:uncharacterized protein BCR37DRAFT_111976 [Protomyces lactucae-debilis]ORY78675.1 hypothetical protein BCR37DRAFT_111976 [Protomyces lactucae-debilis]